MPTYIPLIMCLGHDSEMQSVNEAFQFDSVDLTNGLNMAGVQRRLFSTVVVHVSDEVRSILANEMSFDLVI